MLPLISRGVLPRSLLDVNIARSAIFLQLEQALDRAFWGDIAVKTGLLLVVRSSTSSG